MKKTPLKLESKERLLLNSIKNIVARLKNTQLHEHSFLGQKICLAKLTIKFLGMPLKHNYYFKNLH